MNQRKVLAVKLLVLLSLAFTVILPSVIFTQATMVPNGNGTPDNPYLINRLEHLVWLSENVKTSEGKHYIMTGDIDASETATWNDDGTDKNILEGFKPIGTTIVSSRGLDNYDASFQGVFDGRGHTITSLTINRPNANCVGLFGTLGRNSRVENLGLAGCNIRGRNVVGILTGENQGYTTKVYVTGYVTGQNTVGGMFGLAEGRVRELYASCIVKGNSNVGGLIGYSDSYLRNVYATGAVMGHNRVGGLIGYQEGGVTNGYAACIVRGQTQYTGGLIGFDDASKISESYWDIQISKQKNSQDGAGKTTAQLKQKATFHAWDLTDIWAIDEGKSYPYLKSLPAPIRLDVIKQGKGEVKLSPEPQNGGYAPGTVVTLTAVPSEKNSTSCNWQGVNSSNKLTATVITDNHKCIVVGF